MEEMSEEVAAFVAAMHNPPPPLTSATVAAVLYCSVAAANAAAAAAADAVAQLALAIARRHTAPGETPLEVIERLAADAASAAARCDARFADIANRTLRHILRDAGIDAGIDAGVTE